MISQLPTFLSRFLSPGQKSLRIGINIGHIEGFAGLCTDSAAAFCPSGHFKGTSDGPGWCFMCCPRRVGGRWA